MGDKKVVFPGIQPEDIMWHVERYVSGVVGHESDKSDWKTLDDAISHMSKLMRYDFELYDIPENIRKETVKNFMESLEKSPVIPKYEFESNGIGVKCTAKKELVKMLYKDRHLKKKKPKIIVYESTEVNEKKKSLSL